MSKAITTNTYNHLNSFLQEKQYSSIYLLVDEHTDRHCKPHFLKQLSFNGNIKSFTIPSGEEYKTLDTCKNVWQWLIDVDADRKSLLINLGGGVVTDLGGFVASTFKRGIDFIHVPTSLLAMVDAAIGGKTGVDFNSLKNIIGTITLPQLVCIDTEFLKTLPKAHINSGFAEIIKHGLITSQDYFDETLKYILNNKGSLDEIIFESVRIKEAVVAKDSHENGIRKTLNYGHTLGHAIESYFLQSTEDKTLLHGEAIGHGMILETYISYKLFGFPKEKLMQLVAIVFAVYKKVDFSNQQIAAIIDLMRFDKKNTNGNVNFVLLEAISNPKIDCNVDRSLIIESFEFYKNLN